MKCCSLTPCHVGRFFFLVMLAGLMLACSSSNSTGPILPVQSGDIDAEALRSALNRSDDPDKLLIFKGNMMSGSSAEDRFTAQLEAHVYAISLEDEGLAEITIDGEASLVTVYFIEAFDRGDSFSEILSSGPLNQESPLQAYDRRGEISGVLERGQYFIVLWPSSTIGYRLAVEWASP